MKPTAPVVPQPVIGPDPGGNGGGTQRPLTRTRSSREDPKGMVPSFHVYESPSCRKGNGDSIVTLRTMKLTNKVTSVAAPRGAATTMFTRASPGAEIRRGCPTAIYSR